jgi:hypothetical protein
VLLYDSTKRASSQLKRAYVRTSIEQGESTYALKTTASDVLLIGSHLLIDKYEYDCPRLDAYKTLWPETLVVSFEFCL